MFKALMGGGRSSSDARSTSSSKSSSSRHRKTPSTVSRKSSRGDERDRGLGDLAAYPSSDSRSKRASSTAGDSVASSYATAEPGNSIEPHRIIIERTPRRRDTDEDNRRDRYPEGRDRDGKSARKREGEQTKSERDSRVGRDDAIDSRDRDSGRLPERQRTQSGDNYITPLSTSIPTPTTMPGQPAAPAVYDPHVQQQFPGQFPAVVAEPYRPPNPAGEAADYYGDQGQSVSEQPGVRPKPPTVIPNSQAHLMPASPSVNPPPEPSSMGQVGAAAAYYADDSDLDHQVSQQPSKPSKPSSSSASKPPKPSIQTAGISGTTIAAAAGVVGAAAYGVASSLPQQTASASPHGAAAYGIGSSLPQQNASALPHGAAAYGVGSSIPQQTASAPPHGAAAYGVGSSILQHTTSAPPPIPVPTSTAPSAPPAVSNNNQSSHSHSMATAVGAAAVGVAAGAMLSHHHQQSTPSADHVPQYTMQIYEESPQNGFGYPGPSMANPAFAAAGELPYAASPLHPHHAAVHHGAPFQSGSLAFQQRQRGPLDKFIDFWRDPEGVGKFEDYTETIGVCKYCFEPGTTSQDAPRNHHYDSRRLSADRYSNGSRVDKTSRYTSSEDEGRRRRKKSSRNSWLPGLLGGYAAKSLFSSKDFEDSYSVRSGRVVSSLVDNESVSTTRKSQTSRGVYRRRSRSRDDTDRSSYSESKRNRYEEPRLRLSSRSPSRTLRNSGVKDAALGAVVASTALSVAQSRHRSRSRSRSPKKTKSRKSSSSDFSLVDISTPGRKSVGGGITSFFTASSENRRKRRAKKRRSIFSLNNSSSSSLDADLAFGSGYTKKQTGKSKSKSKKKDRDVDAALLGLGAAATALAATSHRRNRRAGEILAAKDLRSHQSDYASSATNDEGWEDLDSSSVSSALAFGSSALFGSDESQSSDSGTSKWGWRWGGKKDKKKKKKASSSENRFPAGAAVAASALGGAALASAYQKDTRVASQGTISSSGSLQHVSPIPLSDSARFPAQPAFVRPGPIPLQQPQPMVPVSQALYATQGESIPAYSAPTEPPLSPLHDTEWYHRNPNWYEHIDVSPNISREHHRSDSLPLFHTEPLEGTTVSSLKRRSTLKDQASVQFDLTEEQADKERRADRLQQLKREVEHGNGLQLIDRESESVVQDSDRRSSRRYRERDYEKRSDEYNEVERYKPDSQKDKDSSSWIGAAAAGTIGAAAIATVLSGKSSNDESSEVSQRRRDERREQRRAERRRVSEAESMASIPSKSENAQDVVDARSSVDDHQPEHAKSSAFRGVSRNRPVYDDYAQFFAPEELHRIPDTYTSEEPEEFEVPSAPAIVEIKPAGESHPPPPEIPEFNHLPWPVPELKLIEPTPPQSISGSVRGAASPIVSPKETRQDDVTPTERQTTGSRVSWGEHQTHEYDAPSENDSVDNDIRAPADIGADIEFAATVAAATAAAGFDPSLVTDDPTYHTRTSPPGSEANVKFSEGDVETRKDDGKEPKQFIEGQPLYSEPEIVPRGFESKEHSQDVLERLNGMENFDGHLPGEASEKNADSRGRSRGSVSPPEDFFDVPSGFLTEENSENSQRHDDTLRDGSHTVDSAPTSGEIETSARFTTSTEDDGDFEKIERSTDDKEKEKKSGDFLRNIFGSRVSEPVESKRSSSADMQSSREVQSEVAHRRSSRGDNDLSGYEIDDSDKDNGKVESKDGINIGDYKSSRQRKEERRRRRYEDIVESGKAAEHEKDPKISDNNHEGQSFLARRPEMPVNVGDGDNSGASGRFFAEAEVASQGFDVFDQQPSEKTVEPSSPEIIRGQEDTEGPRSRRSSVLRSRESPTAVPIHFRRPPTSPGVHRSPSAGSPATPSPAAPSPGSPTQERPRRPTSTEFKNSREFRPLWLVERHGPGHGEVESDEPLPSLPSSKNSSANASTEDLTALQDENKWEAIDLSHYVQDTRQPGDLDLSSSKGPDQDVWSPEQVTPTEVTFQQSRSHPPSRKDQLKYEFHSPSELLQDPIAYAELPPSLTTGDLPSAESSVVSMKDATVEESGIESIPYISRPSTPQNREIPVSDADITPTQSRSTPRADISDVFRGPGFAGVVDAAVAAAVGTDVGIVPVLDKKIPAESIFLVDDTQKDRPVSPIHSNGSIGFASVVDAAVAASAEGFPNEKEELENIPSGLQPEQPKSVDEVPAVEECSRIDIVSADDSTPFDEGKRDSHATVIPVVEEEVRNEPDKLETGIPHLEETRGSTEPAPEITDKGVDETAQTQPTESTGSSKKKKKNKKKKGQSIDLGNQEPKEDPEAALPTSEETEKTREETTQEAPPAQPASIEQSSVPEETPTISQEPLLPTSEAEPALNAAEVSKALDSEPGPVSEAPEMPAETPAETSVETPVETPADQSASSKKSKRDKKKKRKSKGSAPEENEEEISTVEAVQPSSEITNEEQTPAGGQTEPKNEDTLVEETSKPFEETIAAIPETEQSAAEPVLQDALPSEELSAPSANIENEVEELQQPDNELGAVIAESIPAQEVLEANKDNQDAMEPDTLVSGNDSLTPPLSAETNEMSPTADAQVTEEKSIEPHLADSKPETEQQTEAIQDSQTPTNENEQTEVAKETAETNPSAGLGDQEVENANAESETPLSRKNSKKKKKNKRKNTAEASIENEPSDNVQTAASEGVREAEAEPAVPAEGENQTKQPEEPLQDENKEEFENLVNEDVPAPEAIVEADPAAESQPGTIEDTQEATPEENLEEETKKKKGKKNKKNHKSSTVSELQAELEPEIQPGQSASGDVAETPLLTQTSGEVASAEESQVPPEKITDDVSPELKDVASVPEQVENEPILPVEKTEANESAPHVLEQPDVETVPEPEAGEASSAGKKAKKNKKKKQSLSSASDELTAVEPLPSTDVANENADVPVAPEETSINTDQEPAKEDPIESSAPGNTAAEMLDDEPTTDAGAPMTAAQKKKSKKDKKKKRQSVSVDETPASDSIEKSTSDEVPSDKAVPLVEEPSDVQEVEKGEVAAPEETSTITEPVQETTAEETPPITEPVQETTTESIPTNTDSVQEQSIGQASAAVEDIAPSEEPLTADTESPQEEFKEETVAVQEDAVIEGPTKAEADPTEDIPREESKDETVLDVEGVQDNAQSEELNPEVPENQENDDAVPTAETISEEPVQDDQTTISKKKDKKKKKKRQSVSLEDDQSSPAKDEQITETSSAPLIETANTSEHEQPPAIPDNAENSENIAAEETTQQAGAGENQDTLPVEEAQTTTSKKKKKDKKKRKSVAFDIDEPTTQPTVPTVPAVDLGEKVSQEVEQKLEDESSTQPSQAEESQPEVLAPGDLTKEASATTEPELGDSTSTAEPPVQEARAIEPLPELVTEAPADTLEESAVSQQDQPTPEEKEPDNEAPIPEAKDDTIISAPEVDPSEDKEIEPGTAALPTPEDYEKTEPESQAVDDAEQADGPSKSKDKKKKKKKKKTLELNEEAPAVVLAPVEETQSDSDKFFDATEPEENLPAETAQEEEKPEEVGSGSLSAKAKKKAKKDKKRQSRNLDGTNDSQMTADSAANVSEEGPQDLPTAVEKAPGEFPQEMSESPPFSETESPVPSLETANAPVEEDGKENQSHDTELRGENDKDLTWTDEVYSQVEQQQTTSSDTSSQPVPKANPISAGEAGDSIAIETSVVTEETSPIVDEPEQSAEVGKLYDDGLPAEGFEKHNVDGFETAPTQEGGEAAGKEEASEEVTSRDDVEKMKLDLTKENVGEPLREEQAVDTVQGIEQMATEGPSNGAEMASDLPKLEKTEVPESEETWAPISSKKKKKEKNKKKQETQKEAEEKKVGPSADDMEEKHVETQDITDTEVPIAEENQKEGKTSEGGLEVEKPAAAIELPIEGEAVKPTLEPMQSSENVPEQQGDMETMPREFPAEVEPEGVAEEVNEVVAQSEPLSRKESKKKKKKAKKQAKEEQEETFNPTSENVEGDISADAAAAVPEEPISPPADESNRSLDERISDGQEAQETHAEPSVSLDPFAVPLDTEQKDLNAEDQQDEGRLEEQSKDEDAQDKLRSQALEKQDDLEIAADLVEGQQIQPEATASLSKKPSKKEKRKSKKKSLQETVEPTELPEPEALPESIGETHSIVSPPAENPEDMNTEQHVAVDLPEEQLPEPEVESQSLGTQQFGADEDVWPAIDWEKAKVDTKDQTPPHSSPEARAIPFEPAIIEFDVSAIPEGLTRRLSEDTLSTPSDKKSKKNKKNKRKSEPIETGEMLETPEETQGKKELINEEVKPTEPPTKMEMEPTPEPASEHIVQLTESLISSEHIKKELDMVLPKKSKVASIFPNLERGVFRRPASLQSLQSVKDSAEDETMIANRDSAIQASEAPIAAGDSNHPPYPAMAQDDDKTWEPVTTSTVRGAEEETKSIDIPWNDGNNNEIPLHAPLPVHGQSSSLISSSPMDIDERPARTPSSCGLRRSPSVHGRHHHPPLTWSLENSSITKARTPSPPSSLPVMNPDTVSPPRTPLHTITEQEPEDRVERASRGTARERGTPRLEIKPEHVLPRPETPIRKFTDNALARQAWPTTDQDSLSDRDGEDINIGVKKRRQRGSEFPGGLHKTPEQGKPILMPSSGGSVQSNPNVSSTHRSLRRKNRNASGDLRTASQAHESHTPQPHDSQPPQPPQSDLNIERIASSSTYDPVTDKGKRPVRTMTDVYEGWGETPNSPRSPSRPPSVRHRRSMQHLQELESRLDQLVSENRLLIAAREAAENKLKNASLARRKSDHALNTRDADLRDREAEVEQLKSSVEWLQKEVARLTEENEGLATTNSNLTAAHATEIQTVRETSTRELGGLRSQYQQLSTDMQERVRQEIEAALAQKNIELRRLREELEAARDKVTQLQQQIAASMHDNVLVFRDEDYFAAACQKLCGHVQQWVLRFSKHSDHRRCRKLGDLQDEKIADRFDNAILDGSDIDTYLTDRIRRRDVFMSVTMAMVWEFVFTRYLFGMDREQRQKLKSLEKQLGEIGPRSAVHRWRATTLTLLSKRSAFARQRESDTEAVALEIFETLSRLLPLPSHVEGQLLESLRKVLRVAVNLSVEMRTQLAEYIMLPPLQPEYDTNGDLARQVYFNASLMNERSGETTSNEELESQQAVVRIVLFPLVVKKGNDTGDGEDEVVVSPAQVLVARPDNDKGVSKMLSNDRMSLDATKSVHSMAPSSNMDISNVV